MRPGPRGAAHVLADCKADALCRNVVFGREVGIKTKEEGWRKPQTSTGQG